MEERVISSLPSLTVTAPVAPQEAIVSTKVHILMNVHVHDKHLCRLSDS